MYRCCLIACLLGIASTFAAIPAGYAERLAELLKPVTTNPTNTVALYTLAKFCHDAGAKDNEEAAKLAEKYFTELLRLQPTNALATAYLGSTLTMRARDSFWPTRQLSLVKEGIRTMDRAVALATNDITIRMVRAMNNVHMPRWLDREPVVREDFAWLWAQVQKQPAAFATDDKQDIARCYGEALAKAKQKDQARKIWQAGLEFDPQSKEAAALRKQLEKSK